MYTIQIFFIIKQLYKTIRIVYIGVPSIGAWGPGPPPPVIFKNLQTGPPVCFENYILLDGSLKLVTLLKEKLIIHLFSIYL